MFGKLNVVTVARFMHVQSRTTDCADEALARLLDLTEHPRIEKLVQFPKALFVFLIVPGDPESGAFYLYDRCARVWYWLDFEDEKFGGYSASDFDRLVRECRFLDLVEQPQLLADERQAWIVTCGSRPRRSYPIDASTFSKIA